MWFRCPPPRISWLRSAITVWAWEESFNSETCRHSKTLSDGGPLVCYNACSQRKSTSWMSSFSTLVLNNFDNPRISSWAPVGHKFTDQLSKIVSIWEIGWLVVLSALRHWSSFGSVFAYRDTFSMLTPSSNPSLHVIDFGVMRSSSNLAAPISYFHCNARVWDSSPSSNLCSKVHNPALKFRMVSEFRQMHLRGRMTRIYRASLGTSPDTRGMVSHRFETISAFQTLLLQLFSQKWNTLLNAKLPESLFHSSGTHRTGWQSKTLTQGILLFSRAFRCSLFRG